jgi:hypothetical protein
MLGALMPDDAIISNESVSFGRDFYKQTHAAAPHDWLNLAGGAIGDGLPVATGAAIASGAKRRVISLQADGSAMYSLQALWTQAREKLPCTTILLNNRKYNILIGEYRNVGARPGTTAMSIDRERWRRSLSRAPYLSEPAVANRWLDAAMYLCLQRWPVLDNRSLPQVDLSVVSLIVLLRLRCDRRSADPAPARQAPTPALCWPVSNTSRKQARLSRALSR